MTFEIAYDPCYNDHILSSKCDIHLVLEKLLLMSTCWCQTIKSILLKEETDFIEPQLL